jgi:hypothetical protein
VQVDDVGHSSTRETDNERTGEKSCWKLTDIGIDNGSAKMPMALQNSVQWKSQDLQGECLAHGVQHHDKHGDRSRTYLVRHSHAYISTLEKLGFEEEKG